MPLTERSTTELLNNFLPHALSEPLSRHTVVLYDHVSSGVHLKPTVGMHVAKYNIIVAT